MHGVRDMREVKRDNILGMFFCNSEFFLTFQKTLFRMLKKSLLWKIIFKIMLASFWKSFFWNVKIPISEIPFQNVNFFLLFQKTIFGNAVAFYTSLVFRLCVPSSLHHSGQRQCWVVMFAFSGGVGWFDGGILLSVWVFWGGESKNGVQEAIALMLIM